MDSYLYHLQINIDFQNIAFYKGLMEFMSWKVIFEKDDVVGYKSGTNGDLWLCKAGHNSVNDYDAKGVNHISIRVSDISNIDEVKEYLNKNGVEMLFDTPRHRPEFADSQDETYYQIMFESPDQILFEVVYIGKK